MIFGVEPKFAQKKEVANQLHEFLIGNYQNNLYSQNTVLGKKSYPTTNIQISFRFVFSAPKNHSVYGNLGVWKFSQAQKLVKASKFQKKKSTPQDFDEKQFFEKKS